jgi:hypothetical protein
VSDEGQMLKEDNLLRHDKKENLDGHGLNIRGCGCKDEERII